MIGKKVARIVILITAIFLFSASGDMLVTDTETLFMKMVDDLKGMGDECRDKGLLLQADYFYAQADIAVSSFRLAVNHIYSVRKEEDIERRKREAEEARKAAEEEEDDDWMDLIVDDGGWFEVIEKIEKFNEKLDTLNAQLAPFVARMDSLEAADRDLEYNLWHLLASQSPASPFPWLFEGAVATVKGRTERAAECYSYAVINPNLYRLGEGWDFAFMGALSMQDLAALNKRLEAKELELKNLYVAQSGTNFPREYLNFDDNYLRLLARDVLKVDPTDFNTAYLLYEAAVRANPFEPGNFAGCGLTGAAAGYADGAAYYINQGLLLDPGHKGLNLLKQAMNGGAR